MNTVIVFIVAPLVLGAALLPFTRLKKLQWILVSIFELALVVLAFVIPDDLILHTRNQLIEIKSGLNILSRSLTLPGNLLALTGLFYLNALLFSLLGPLLKTKLNFHALSLIITALLVGALSVEPFLYAAVIYELIALLAFPLLLEKESKASSGLLRFLSQQTIAMAMVLLSAWMLAGVSTLQITNVMILRGAALVILGLALWIPIFPFHIWIGQLYKEHHPWATSFLLTGSQLMSSVLVLIFLQRFSWLKNLPYLFETIRSIALLLIAFAGIFSALQVNFARQTSYLYLTETGYTLLAISLQNETGLTALSLMTLPRMMSIWLWAYCLSLLRNEAPKREQNLENLNGLMLRKPLIALGMIIAQLSLMGLPLFGVFNGKGLIWFESPMLKLSEQWPFFLGILGMFVFLLRLIRAVVGPEDPLKSLPEPLIQQNYSKLVQAFLILGIFLIILTGLFPQLIQGHISNALDAFLPLVNGL